MGIRVSSEWQQLEKLKIESSDPNSIFSRAGGDWRRFPTLISGISELKLLNTHQTFGFKCEVTAQI